MTDTHAHLDACEEPAATLVARARAAGVTRVITIGTGVESCRAALALADELDGVHAALGIDPHRAGSRDASRTSELRELLAHPKAVAVGETGLDGVRSSAPLAEQLRLFDAQLELAAELGLPVVVHSREAAGGTADALAGFAGTVVLHCFSSPALLPTALERGYFVSFAGNVTFPGAADLREAAAAVPDERLLVETDSPFLAPQPVRGRRNEPAYLPYTVRVLAEVRETDPERLARQTHANAAAAFALP